MFAFTRLLRLLSILKPLLKSRTLWHKHHRCQQHIPLI